MDTQRSFFDDELYADLEAKKLARASDPVTSHQAASEVDVHALRSLCLRLIRENPGSTARELDEIDYFRRHRQGEQQRMRRRAGELVRMGLARHGEKRACRVTGKQAFTLYAS